MKKIIASILIATMLSACGAPINYDGKHYPTVGLFNQGTDKSDKMCYDVSVGNVVWGILLSETIVAPVYFFGFSLWNPIGPKGPNGCGIDAQ